MPNKHEILEEAKVFFEAEYNISGKILMLNISNTKYYCYINRCFMLIEIEKDTTYRVSFSLNNKEFATVALYTKELSLRFQDDLEISEDCYIEAKTGKVFFGKEAKEKFRQDVIEANGLLICEYCNMAIPEENFIKNKMCCDLCEPEISNILYH